MQPPAALGAGRDAGQQMGRGAHHVLAPRRVGEQLDQPLMGVGVDDRRPLGGGVLLALPFPQPGQPGRDQRADDRGLPPLPGCDRLDVFQRSTAVRNWLTSSPAVLTRACSDGLNGEIVPGSASTFFLMRSIVVCPDPSGATRSMTAAANDLAGM